VRADGRVGGRLVGVRCRPSGERESVVDDDTVLDMSPEAIGPTPDEGAGEIIAAYAEGQDVTEIGRRYGVSAEEIHRLVADAPSAKVEGREFFAEPLAFPICRNGHHSSSGAGPCAMCGRAEGQVQDLPASPVRESFASRHPVWFLLGFFGLLVLGPLGIWWGATAGERGAEGSCKEAVSNQLVSPASAQFEISIVTESASGLYVVNGTVDSQNGFGAMLRAHFECVVNDDGTAVVDYLR
jgi:hypothetical protein